MSKAKWILQLMGVVVLLGSPAIAKDLGAKSLGTYGHTFEIGEESLLDLILSRLSLLQENGKIDQHQKSIQEAVRLKVLNPAPVKGLKSATKTRGFTFDPSITLTSDIRGPDGQVLIPRGQTFNPLDQVSLSKPLVFFNGENEVQKAWVFKHLKDAKLILTRGKPIPLAEEWGRAVYFDQGGKLTEKLKIKATPAVVQQKGKFLEIQEMALEVEQ